MTDLILPTVIEERPDPQPEPIHMVRHITDTQEDGTRVEIEVHHNAPEL
jgi:hypothetical protein